MASQASVRQRHWLGLRGSAIAHVLYSGPRDIYKLYYTVSGLRTRRLTRSVLDCCPESAVPVVEVVRETVAGLGPSALIYLSLNATGGRAPASGNQSNQSTNKVQATPHIR